MYLIELYMCRCMSFLNANMILLWSCERIGMVAQVFCRKANLISTLSMLLIML